MESIEVAAQSLQPFHFDATHCPDLFPPLAVLAACCEGTSVITGTERLTFKESNRAQTLKEEFGKLGIGITLANNQMYITGGKVIGGKVNSHNDHRIAMALAILSLVSQSPIEIENAQAVNKSYPGFYKDLEAIASKDNS